VAGSAQARGWFEVRDAEFQAVCPYCLEVLQITMPLTGTRPEPGWVSVCMECAHVSIFEQNESGLPGHVQLKLRQASEAELATAMAFTSVRLLHDAARERHGSPMP
jgi:hypothetical protein